MCSVEARRGHRRSSQGDVHAALTQDVEDHAEQVAGLAIRGQDLGQVIAGGRSVQPEQRCRGGVTESATQTVVHCTETAAEVAPRPVHGLTERQVEPRFISDVSAVEFVGVTCRPITAGMLEGTLPDKVEPGPSAPGVEAGPCALFIGAGLCTPHSPAARGPASHRPAPATIGPRANHAVQPAQPSRTARTFPAGVPRTAPPTQRRRTKHARVPHQPACIALACDGSRRHARWESCRDQISTARHFLGSASSRGMGSGSSCPSASSRCQAPGCAQGEQGGDSSGASQEELPVQEVLGARVRSQPRNARKIWYAVNPSPPQAIPRPTTAISAIMTWPYRDWRAEARLGLRGS